MALRPDGPVLGVASTVTAWLTHTVGFGSSGVLSDTPTESLSTLSVSDIDACVDGPAAFVAWRVRGIWPAPLT
jgi:hypothetical protein